MILGHGVKGQGQLWHSVYKTLWAGYRLHFLINHVQTSHVSCVRLEEEPYGVMGSKVKVNFAPLQGMPRFALSNYHFLLASISKINLFECYPCWFSL